MSVGRKVTYGFDVPMDSVFLVMHIGQPLDRTVYLKQVRQDSPRLILNETSLTISNSAFGSKSGLFSKYAHAEPFGAHFEMSNGHPDCLSIAKPYRVRMFACFSWAHA